MRVQVTVGGQISQSSRVRQLGGLFDCPVEEKQLLSWGIDCPIEAQPWQIGLVCGPSGAGKSTVANALFPGLVDQPVAWSNNAVIDDFPANMSMQQITKVLSSVGFNTIPAWMRPYAVLSNGEKFRVDLARRLCQPQNHPVVVDEFTSVVDRQVAQIGSYAVQKVVRGNPGQQFVAVTCHEDVIEWLQPDWVIWPATGTFERRSVRRKPHITIEIRRVDPAHYWPVFKKYHYMSADLPTSCHTYCAFVGEQPVSIIAIGKMPSPHTRNLLRVARAVTLPDWQGIGINTVFAQYLAQVHRSAGWRYRSYPAHPALIRTRDKSPHWALIQKPGQVRTGKVGPNSNKISQNSNCAVFEYCGPIDPSDPNCDHLRFGRYKSLNSQSPS